MHPPTGGSFDPHASIRSRVAHVSDPAVYPRGRGVLYDEEVRAAEDR